MGIGESQPDTQPVPAGIGPREAIPQAVEDIVMEERVEQSTAELPGLRCRVGRERQPPCAVRILKTMSSSFSGVTGNTEGLGAVSPPGEFATLARNAPSLCSIRTSKSSYWRGFTTTSAASPADSPYSAERGPGRMIHGLTFFLRHPNLGLTAAAEEARQLSTTSKS